MKSSSGGFRLWHWPVFTIFLLLLLPARAEQTQAGSNENGPAETKAKGNFSRFLGRMVRPFAAKSGKEAATIPETEQKVPEESITHSPESSSTGESPGSENYIIGFGDVLAIQVWQEPQISRSVPVRTDGKISMPLAGEIQASGLTPLELQARITEALKTDLSNPEVTVIVEKMTRPKFNILGEVAQPGSYELAPGMTVLDAIAAGGGFRDFAKVKDIYILRRVGSGSPVRLPFNYKEVTKGKKFEQNVELQTSDTIVVP